MVNKLILTHVAMTWLVLVMVVILETKTHMVALQAQTIEAVEEAVRAVLAVSTEKTRLLVVRKTTKERNVVAVVCTAAVEGVRGLRLAVDTAHLGVSVLSGVSVKTVRHDPFRTHTAPKNLR